MNGETRPALLTNEDPRLTRIGEVWEGMLQDRFKSWEFSKILFPKIRKQLTRWKRSLQDKFGEACLLSLLLVFERTRATTFPPIADHTFTKDPDGARRLGDALGIIPVISEQEGLLEQMIKFWQDLPRGIAFPHFIADSFLADFIRGKDESLRDLIHQYFSQGGQPQEVFTTMAKGLQDCLSEQLARAGSHGR